MSRTLFQHCTYPATYIHAERLPSEGGRRNERELKRKNRRQGRKVGKWRAMTNGEEERGVSSEEGGGRREERGGRRAEKGVRSEEENFRREQEKEGRS